MWLGIRSLTLRTALPSILSSFSTTSTIGILAMPSKPNKIKDVPTNHVELHIGLRRIVEDIQSTGFVALPRTQDNGPNPSFVIEGFSPISLLLSDRDAEVLIKQVRRSHLGME
jgi:hypothetical protein